MYAFALTPNLLLRAYVLYDGPQYLLIFLTNFEVSQAVRDRMKLKKGYSRFFCFKLYLEIKRSYFRKIGKLDLSTFFAIYLKAEICGRLCLSFYFLIACKNPKLFDNVMKCWSPKI